MTRLVIANRGEIARRILRTARERGFTTAVISTSEDRDSLVRAEADDVLEVPSFLDPEAIVAASRSWKAKLLHPGYGFLSENADFAQRVETADIRFVGPCPETMRELGNKERAKELARKCDIPTLASLSSKDLPAPDDAELAKLLSEALAAQGIDPPYLVKAAGGGGGRGMRIVETLEKLPAALARASEEAAAGFADPTVFVERFLATPRHVEIQVLGDGRGGGMFLGERECSLQRRYQKVLEEAPSPVVSRELRERMGRAAMALVRETSYRGAGTVEFLVDQEGDEDAFYFLEVNTRLQVEHPVTELVYDLDLVAAQFDISEGRWPESLPDPTTFTVVEPKRVAIEARVLAEDPRHEFLPTPGPLVRYREPKGVGVRVDSGVSEGGRVHPQFDSMIAKVIAFGESRAQALATLSKALEAMIVHGATTNLAFLQSLVRHPQVRAARFDTNWIGRHLDELNRLLVPETLATRLATSGFRESLSQVLAGKTDSRASEMVRRFRRMGNRVARVGSRYEQRGVALIGDASLGDIELSGDGMVAVLADADIKPKAFPYSESFAASVDRARREPQRLTVPVVATKLRAQTLALTVFGETFQLEDPRRATHRRGASSSVDGELHAPMAGKVLQVLVASNDLVEEGEVLLVLESMKMQLEVRAPVSGRVAELLVEPGQVLDGPDLVAVVVS